MGFDGSGVIWMDGKLVPWNEATVHVGAHALHYGSSVFEGIRMYHRGETDGKSVIFRMREHFQRLYNSAKIYRMTPDEMKNKAQQTYHGSLETAENDNRLKYTVEEMEQACFETLKANGDKAAYIRPVIYKGYHSLGVDPRPCPVSVFIMTWSWGKYLGPEALELGVDVCVSSWNRMAPNTFPALAKCGANYMNSQLIKQEAIKNGYSEGIAIDTAGYVSEGSGENIFVVFHGKGKGGCNRIYTPPLGNSVLPGITRESIITLLQEDMGCEVEEHMIPREMLYLADEVFFTGTASEVTPIRSIDQIKVGEGRRGPVAGELQERFFGIIDGKAEDKRNWLTFVDVG